MKPIHTSSTIESVDCEVQVSAVRCQPRSKQSAYIVAMEPCSDNIDKDEFKTLTSRWWVRQSRSGVPEWNFCSRDPKLSRIAGFPAMVLFPLAFFPSVSSFFPGRIQFAYYSVLSGHG